jgi:hypothetical protein
LTSFVEPLSESVLATTSSIRLTRLEDGVPQANRLLLDRPVDHETVAVQDTYARFVRRADGGRFPDRAFMIPLAPETRGEVLPA